MVTLTSVHFGLNLTLVSIGPQQVDILAKAKNVTENRHGILGHLGVECTSGGTTIPLNLIETEQELKGSLK